MTRSELKEVIRECLVEVLAEGLGAGRLEEVRRHGSTKYTTDEKQSGSRHPLRRQPELIKPIKHGPVVPNEDFMRGVNSTVKTITTDKTLQGILADTAATTLQEQEIHGHSGSGAVADRAAAVASAADPMEMFASSNRWADLAFSGPKLT
jgi:hypothetical protein